MKQQDPCADNRLLSLDAALQRIRATLSPVAGIERLALRQAASRILAEDLLAPLDLPPFDNAAMDGYALRAGGIEPEACLRVVGTAAAGHPYTGPLAEGECVRIYTGAALPEQADTVVAQEDVVREGGTIRLAGVPKTGRHVRRRGEEIVRGERLLSAGRRLAPADLGLLASAGLPEVAVRRRLRVAFLSTGDELRPLGAPLAYGEIHESNRYMLHGLLAEAGIEGLDLGTLRDDPAAIGRALSEAAGTADAVITTGGASVGDADFIARVLGEIGRIEFWKVAIKPGKPFAFGHIGACAFFGLPGNPVSALVTYRQLVRPALLQLMGTEPAPPLRLRAIAESRLRKAPGRVEFQRGVYRRDETGGYTVRGLAEQGSHRLTSVSAANCFILLPMDSTGAEPGTAIEIEPFDNPV